MEVQMVAAVTIPPAEPDPLKTLLRRLLPTPVVPALPPKPVPTELECLLQRLLGEVQAPKPAPPAKSGITDLKTLLQGLLPTVTTLAGVVTIGVASLADARVASPADMAGSVAGGVMKLTVPVCARTEDVTLIQQYAVRDCSVIDSYVTGDGEVNCGD